MSDQHVALFDSARTKWPNQPLVVMEIDGEMEIVPIGHRLYMTTPHTVVVIGIIHADDSVTALASTVRPS